MRLADCREGSEGVEGAVDSGAGCGVEEKGRFASCFGFLDQALEFRGDHAAVSIDRDGNDILGAEAKEIGGFLDGVMAMG